MLSKKERTMDRYKKAGAEMRLLKTLGGNAAVDISLVLSAADTDKFLKALRMIEEVSLRAEDNMFRDHPELPDEYVDVFFGDTDKKPRTIQTVRHKQLRQLGFKVYVLDNKEQIGGIIDDIIKG